MDISISVRLMDKYISIMAIPFHVPEGVGPAIDANNNNSQRNIHTTTQERINNINNNNNNRRVTVQNSDTPAATGIHEVELRGSDTRINLHTFPRQLFTELSALYNSFCVVPPQPTIADPISPFDMSSINNQDNQGSSSGGGGGMTTRADQVVTRSQLPLPDIIQCHAGLSLEASYRGCRVRRRRNSQVSNDRRPRLTPRRPSSNNNEQADHIQENGPHDDENDGDGDEEDEEELNSDWTLELKLLVGPWRQAGIELRAIADRYQLENSRRRERENLESRRYLQLRLIVNMAIPAAAILAWGVSWLRRH